ncbi:hypothetical protein [Luteitalea sp.]|uniref:hypothetical protein n=1 Tax=Luteitalea sp. TaxID=2004800 RepID=UPI0025BFF0F9|nr:hypothetical protein [Luteitalea sp.]
MAMPGSPGAHDVNGEATTRPRLTSSQLLLVEHAESAALANAAPEAMLVGLQGQRLLDNQQPAKPLVNERGGPRADCMLPTTGPRTESIPALQRLFATGSFARHLQIIAEQFEEGWENRALSFFLSRPGGAEVARA